MKKENCTVHYNFVKSFSRPVVREVLPLHRFSFTYVLHSTVIDSIVSTLFLAKGQYKSQLWRFQPDGATVHTTLDTRQWLEQKFNQGVSRAGHSPKNVETSYHIVFNFVPQYVMIFPSSLIFVLKQGQNYFVFEFCPKKFCPVDNIT